jgi:hypothetical protein
MPFKKEFVTKYSLFPKGMLPFGDFSSQKQNWHPT